MNEATCESRGASLRAEYVISSRLSLYIVLGEKIEYAALDGSFLAHCRLPRLQVCL